jgi:hypothetical protein
MNETAKKPVDAFLEAKPPLNECGECNDRPSK